MFATIIIIIILSLKGRSFTLQNSPIISCLCDKTRHYAAQNNIYTAPTQPHSNTQHSLWIHLPQLSTGHSPKFASIWTTVREAVGCNMKPKPLRYICLAIWISCWTCSFTLATNLSLQSPSQYTTLQRITVVNCVINKSNKEIITIF